MIKKSLCIAICLKSIDLCSSERASPPQSIMQKNLSCRNRSGQKVSFLDSGQRLNLRNSSPDESAKATGQLQKMDFDEKHFEKKYSKEKYFEEKYFEEKYFVENDCYNEEQTISYRELNRLKELKRDIAGDISDCCCGQLKRLCLLGGCIFFMGWSCGVDAGKSSCCDSNPVCPRSMK